MNWSRLVVIFTGLLFQYVSCDMSVMGCSGGYVTLQCPDDDYISVTDIRYTNAGNGRMCPPHTRPMDVAAPLVQGEAPSDVGVAYIEDICEGKQSCAFQISPHVKSDRDNYGVLMEAEVFVHYTCNAGNKRMTYVIVVAVIASVFFLVIVILFICSTRKFEWPDMAFETYDVFQDDQTASANVSRQGSTSSRGQSKEKRSSPTNGNNDNYDMAPRDVKYSASSPDQVVVAVGPDARSTQ